MKGFLSICLLILGKIVGVFGKEPLVMQKWEELKIEKAREEWKKLITQGSESISNFFSNFF